MHKVESTRKTRFKAALAFSNLSQKDWSEKNDIAYMHLYYVVLHDGTDGLLEKVDRFIEEVERQVA